MTPPLKVLILEDDRIIGRDILEIVEAMKLYPKKVHSYDEGIKILENFQPDLLLCDINLGTLESGIDFAKQALTKYFDLKIIYITAHSDSITLGLITTTNPVNFIVKPFSKNQLVATITLMLNERNKVSSELQKIETLSRTEKIIIKLIADKLSSKQIAEKLFISDKTVRNHRYNIAKKLNLPQENNSLLTWAFSFFYEK